MWTKLLNGCMNIAERRYFKEKKGKILTRFFYFCCPSPFGYVLKKNRNYFFLCLLSLLPHKNLLSILFGYYQKLCNPRNKSNPENNCTNVKGSNGPSTEEWWKATENRRTAGTATKRTTITTTKKWGKTLTSINEMWGTTDQMEELLLKSLYCTKAPENDITMYSTIETFE